MHTNFYIIAIGAKEPFLVYTGTPVHESHRGERGSLFLVTSDT